MSKYFDKMGNPPRDGEVNDIRLGICIACDEFFKNMRKNKASIIEMRAMEQILISEISTSAIMEILNRQVEIDEIEVKKINSRHKAL